MVIIAGLDPGAHTIPGTDLKSADHLISVMARTPFPYADYKIWIGTITMALFPFTLADAFKLRNTIAIMEGQDVIDQEYQLVRGDQWNGPVITYTHADDPFFDFTGAIVSSTLRATWCDTHPIYTFTLSPDTSVLGKCSVQLYIPPEDSTNLPCGALLGSVRLELPPTFGPFTFVKFSLTVTG